MFGPEYYRVGGYIGDGEVFCADCWRCDTVEEEHRCATSEAELEEAFPEGIECAECGRWVVEPPEEKEEAP